MNLSIVGTGYVGLVTGAFFAEKGHHVVCIDVDPDKIDKTNRGEPPFFEHGLEELLRKNIANQLSATLDTRSAILGSDITLIAGRYPVRRHAHRPRLRRGIGAKYRPDLAEKYGSHVVVVKSTVVPGTTDNVVLPILEEVSGKRAGQDFGVGMNPEFLTEGEAVGDFMEPDRIICGGIDVRTQQGRRMFDKASVEYYEGIGL